MVFRRRSSILFVSLSLIAVAIAKMIASISVHIRVVGGEEEREREYEMRGEERRGAILELGRPAYPTNIAASSTANTLHPSHELQIRAMFFSHLPTILPRACVQLSTDAERSPSKQLINYGRLPNRSTSDRRPRQRDHVLLQIVARRQEARSKLRKFELAAAPSASIKFTPQCLSMQ